MNPDRLVLAPVAGSSRERADLVALAARRGFTHFLLPVGDPDATAEGRVVHRRSPDGIVAADATGSREVPVVEIRDPKDLERARELGLSAGAVAVSWTAERIIPLENLIAGARGRFTTWVLVDRLEDLPAMLGALEHGADRIVVDLRGSEDVDRIERSVELVHLPDFAWEVVPVCGRRPAGLGDRVIVDTTSLLAPDEGMLIGSVAAFLLHVASEAEGSRFTRPRPFRVNAGAAHSYALMADGTTRYLAELAPGDSVAVTVPRGAARSVRVGRIKIERRPLVEIDVRKGERTYTVFLQDAETVRLSGPDGRRATPDLVAGSLVFGAALPPARHLGAVVQETIEER